MTQVFDSNGVKVGVTVIQAGPCPVIQKKTMEKDRYCAIQLGFDAKREKSTTKPLKGHFDKAQVSPRRYVREIRFKCGRIGEL
jgi:large subunit ribosomal protein L3